VRWLLVANCLCNKFCVVKPSEPEIPPSDATLPATIVFAKGTPRGIVLTFSKPMNFVAASNVNNYAVHWTSEHSKEDDLGPFALLLPCGSPQTYSSSSGLVRLKSAHYDPATQAGTLITKRKLTNAASSGQALDYVARNLPLIEAEREREAADVRARGLDRPTPSRGS
jgi:hypothetical protein